VARGHVELFVIEEHLGGDVIVDEGEGWVSPVAEGASTGDGVVVPGIGVVNDDFGKAVTLEGDWVGVACRRRMARGVVAAAALLLAGHSDEDGGDVRLVDFD
jgi:hypothetical protein